MNFDFFGGRKMFLALFLAILTGALAAYGKLTTDVAGVLVTIYGGYSYANQKITTASLAKEST